MPVQIDFDSDGTRIDDNGKAGWLILTNPERDENYASWRFYTEDYGGPKIDSAWWTWENPGGPIEDITLSPSLILEWDDPNTFHIFIRDGGVEHCGDCQCGCS